MPNIFKKRGIYTILGTFFLVIALFAISLVLTKTKTPVAKAASVDINCATGSPRDITQGTDFESGDELTLSGVGTCVLTNTATLASLTIGNGSTATVLTHAQNTTSQLYSLDITTTGNINVTAGASINVDGKGFTQDQGTGKGVSQSGAGHGGAGGAGIGAGGSAYCTASNPATIGSGGSSGVFSSGGSGGGLITLAVAGILTIDGTITADGGNNSGGGYGGGGAGGGINITAASVASTTTPQSFTITGGTGGVDGSGAGGGGGGCVYIAYTSTNSVSSGGGYFDLSGGDSDGPGGDGVDGVFTEFLRVPEAPTTLFSHSTDASAGGADPINLTSLTPVFSAICNIDGGTCTHYYMEVDDDNGFGSPNWQSGQTDIADFADGNRSGNITYAGTQLKYNTTYYWRIKFQNANGAGVWSAGTDTFYAPRIMELLNFNFGGTVQEGHDVDIEWKSFNGEADETVKLEYSTDDFSTDINEITASAASVSSATSIRSYTWTIPTADSVCSGATCSTVEIRISSNNDGNNYAITSESNFTIQEASATVTSTGRTFDDSNFYTLSDAAVAFNSGDASHSVNNWYNASWLKRKKITFTADAGKIPATQTNFPVLINISSDSDLSASAQADGDDILFTSSNGTTKINHEIETYTTGTGAIIAWVNVPSLSASTEIYMYYGNAGAANQQAVTSTWNSDFKAVWHMNEASGTVFDATTNDYDGTPSNISSETGTINGAQSFNGSSSDITFGTWFDYQAFTISFWIKPGTTQSQYADIIDNNHDGDSNWVLQQNNTTANQFGWGGENFDMTASTWQHLVINKSGTTCTAYLDNVSVASGTCSDFNYDASPTRSLSLGHHPSFGRHWKGEMDEVKISNIARSVNWLTTEYQNQNSPADFYSLDSEVDYVAPGSETIVPKTGHIFSTVSNFAATTSGTGAVKFQVTSDGTNWKYCVGDTLTAASAGYAHSNVTAELTNNCLDDMAAGTFNVRTYLYAGEGQTATISKLSALVVSNSAPTASAISPSQTAIDTVTLTSTIADSDSDVTSLTVEYSTDNSNWNNATIGSAVQSEDGVDGVTTASGSITGIDTDNDGSVDLTITWSVGTDLPETADSTVYFRITPSDGTIAGTAATSSAFAIDTNLAGFSNTAKKYLPTIPAPKILNKTESTIDLSITNVKTHSPLEYSIQEKNSGKYLQTNSILGTDQAWQSPDLWGNNIQVKDLFPNQDCIFNIMARIEGETNYIESPESIDLIPEEESVVEPQEEEQVEENIHTEESEDSGDETGIIEEVPEDTEFTENYEELDLSYLPNMRKVISRITEVDKELAKKWLNHYYLIYHIKCFAESVKPSSAICFNAKLDLIYAQKISNMVKANIKLSERELFLLKLRVIWPEKRYFKGCVESSGSLDRCSSLGESLKKIYYFIGH